MSERKRVRLFRSGRNQAVRIPVEFELPGHEAIPRLVQDIGVFDAKGSGRSLKRYCLKQCSRCHCRK